MFGALGYNWQAINLIWKMHYDLFKYVKEAGRARRDLLLTANEHLCVEKLRDC